LTDEETQPPKWQGLWVLGVVVFCVLALLSFVWADARVVEWVHAHRVDAWAKRWVWVRKLRVIWPGHFFFTLLIAAIVTMVHRLRWRGSVLVLAAGVITAANSVIKWCAGRSRPDWKTGTPGMDFHPLRGGWDGLIHQENLAFPSGDVALAVSTAAALTYLWPRGAVAWWALAVIVAFQRVAENAHHVSDVLAAGALGVAAFHCARVACRVLLDARAEAPGFPVVPPGTTD
jgi:membrane-associated phospholipid phosphatase